MPTSKPKGRTARLTIPGELFTGPFPLHSGKSGSGRLNFLFFLLLTFFCLFLCRLKGNAAKNRYTDVLCYDHSRVVLSMEDSDDPCSDYINANYVDGYKQKNAFISTQGPLPKTYGDFWRMIWEQQCAVVVMTTRCLERGRPKCGQYWPLGEEESAEYGHFEIVNLTTEQQSDYTISMLHLTNLKVPSVSVYGHVSHSYSLPTTLAHSFVFPFPLGRRVRLGPWRTCSSLRGQTTECLFLLRLCSSSFSECVTCRAVWSLPWATRGSVIHLALPLSFTVQPASVVQVYSSRSYN